MTTKLRIISGGQSGADLGGLVAAERYGLIGEFGGWMPKGWPTEDGPKPEYEARFRMRECPVLGYLERTSRNVIDSDATIFFGQRSPGFSATYLVAMEVGKPFSHIETSRFPAAQLAAWIVEMKVGVVNIAGNRESRSPGICDRVERYLSEAFEALGYKEIASS